MTRRTEITPTNYHTAFCKDKKLMLLKLESDLVPQTRGNHPHRLSKLLDNSRISPCPDRHKQKRDNQQTDNQDKKHDSN